MKRFRDVFSHCGIVPERIKMMWKYAMKHNQPIMDNPNGLVIIMFPEENETSQVLPVIECECKLCNPTIATTSEMPTDDQIENVELKAENERTWAMVEQMKSVLACMVEHVNAHEDACSSCNEMMGRIYKMFEDEDKAELDKPPPAPNPKDAHPCPVCGKEMTYYEDGYYYHCYEHGVPGFKKKKKPKEDKIITLYERDKKPKED